MLRSLNNSASGLTSFGHKIDVIAHNLANINTAAYKKQRVTFTEMFYQSLARPGLPVNRNPADGKEVIQGAGVKIGGTLRDFDKVPWQRQAGLDFAIQGPGSLKWSPGWLAGLYQKRLFYLDGDPEPGHLQGTLTASSFTDYEIV